MKETQWNKSLSTLRSLKSLLFSTDSREALTATVSVKRLRKRQIFSGVSVWSEEGTSTIYCLERKVSGQWKADIITHDCGLITVIISILTFYTREGRLAT